MFDDGSGGGRRRDVKVRRDSAVTVWKLQTLSKPFSSVVAKKTIFSSFVRAHPSSAQIAKVEHICVWYICVMITFGSSHGSQSQALNQPARSVCGTHVGSNRRLRYRYKANNKRRIAWGCSSTTSSAREFSGCAELEFRCRVRVIV